MIRAMCEQFVARAAEPFRLAEVWPFVEALERYGIAGFGWGAAWRSTDGSLSGHRSTAAFRDDPAAGELATIETTTLLVHLRRPSRLSTLQLPDAQPFVDPAGRFAFGHNGELERWHALRARYREDGRIHGRADTEVAQRWLEDAWTEAGTVPTLLGDLHRTFGGEANLAVIGADGSAHHHAGNRENPVFSFRHGRIGVASTGIYSIDRSLFRFVAPGATHRRLARQGHTVALDEDGHAIDTGRAHRAGALAHT
jgi:glutamine phosphoribosylpyrophosphate amidotransferase